MLEDASHHLQRPLSHYVLNKHALLLGLINSSTTISVTGKYFRLGATMSFTKLKFMFNLFGLITIIKILGTYDHNLS